MNIDTQLDCRATASLREEIAKDLSMPDKPLDSLLSEIKEKDNDESQEQQSDNI